MQFLPGDVGGRGKSVAVGMWHASAIVQMFLLLSNSGKTGPECPVTGVFAALGRVVFVLFAQAAGRSAEFFGKGSGEVLQVAEADFKGDLGNGAVGC